MPVSKTYNCIFVHIPKTAGTSVEAALGMNGKYDRVGLEPMPNNDRDTEHFFGKALQHLPARRLRKHPELPLNFKKAYRFTFVRNPWARLISALTFRGGFEQAQQEKSPDFYADEVDKMYRLHQAGEVIPGNHFKLQTWYFQNQKGKSLVDFIGRFERLEEDFAVVTAAIGSDAKLEHRMPSNHKPYQELFTPTMVDQAAQIYAADIAALRYTFDK